MNEFARLSGDGHRDLLLGRDRAALCKSSEPPSEILVPAEIDARAPLRSDDPRDVGNVGLAELGAGEVGACIEGRVQLRELGIERLRRLPFKQDAVVGAGKLIEAFEPKPNERALGRPRREKRRLRMALLEVLHDYARLRQDDAALLQDRDPADRVLLVEPVGAVLQVDLDRLVGDLLLGEEDPNAGAVRQRAAS